MATFSQRILAGADDAEENNSTGAMNLTSSDLEITADFGAHQYVGMRWTNVTIPQGSTINTAYIQFRCGQVLEDGACSATIYGEDVDNSAQFTTTTSNISSRTLTTANVSWPNIPSWQTLNAEGTDQRTPSIVSIISEIIGRAGWSSGNALSIIIPPNLSNSFFRNAYSYNGLTTGAPLLFIDYTEPSSGVSAPAMYYYRLKR